MKLHLTDPNITREGGRKGTEMVIVREIFFKRKIILQHIHQLDKHILTPAFWKIFIRKRFLSQHFM